MANFCTRCGRALREGEICTCGGVSPQQMNAQAGQQAQTGNFAAMQRQNMQQGMARQNYNAQGGMNQNMGQQNGMNQNMGQQGGRTANMGQQNYNAQGGRTANMAGQPYQGGQDYARPQSDFIYRVWNTFLQVLRAPVTSGVAFMQTADIKTASVIVVLQSIMSGFWSIALIGAIKRMAVGGSSYGSYIDVPYGRIFVVSALISCAFIYFLAAVMLLTTMTLGQRFSYTQILCGVAVKSVLLLPVLLLSIVIVQIFVVLGLIVYVIGFFWSILAMFITLVSVVEIDKRNRFAWVLTLFLTVYVFLYMLCSTWGSVGTLAEFF